MQKARWESSCAYIDPGREMAFAHLSAGVNLRTRNVALFVCVHDMRSESWLAGRPRAALFSYFRGTKSRLSRWNLGLLRVVPVGKTGALYNLRPYEGDLQRFSLIHLPSDRFLSWISMKPREKHERVRRNASDIFWFFEIFFATVGILCFLVCQGLHGLMRSQWSTLYHLERGQKAMKPTWLKIPKSSLGLRNPTPNHPATSVFVRPPPQKVDFERKNLTTGKRELFPNSWVQKPFEAGESMWCFFFREIITRCVFFCCEVGHWL